MAINSFPTVREVIEGIQIKTAAKGIAGWEFSMRKQESLTLSSDVTDYYVENNSAIQNNIALNPEQITLNGLIAEKQLTHVSLLYDLASSFNTMIAGGGGLIGGLLPNYIRSKITSIIAAATRALEAATAAAQIAENIFVKVAPLIGAGGAGKAEKVSKQTEAFEMLYGFWKSRTLLTVQTPWITFDNCAIVKVSFTQPESTESLSEISVTLKKIRFANVANDPFVAKRIADAFSELPNISGGASDEIIQVVDDDGNVIGAAAEAAVTIEDRFYP